MTRADVLSDLIIDVGLHTGGDTAHYLSQGYRVVGIEANPELAAQARRRFAAEIESGKLTLLNIGIAEASGALPFWICDRKSEWSSFDRRIAARRGYVPRAVEVPTRRFGEILDEYGTPQYLKIDIEGNDHLCVQELKGRILPRFISLESECMGGSSTLNEEVATQTLDLLHHAGYRRFKLIFQRDFSAVTSSGRISCPGIFEIGNSGPWGDDTPGTWLSLQQAQDVLAAEAASGAESWHDWHAAL